MSRVRMSPAEAMVLRLKQTVLELLPRYAHEFVFTVETTGQIRVSGFLPMALPATEAGLSRFRTYLQSVISSILPHLSH
jgi:hypothetical protein